MVLEMKTSLLAKTLVRAGQVRSFRVLTAQPAGWEAVEQADHRIIHHWRYSDWHRVEWALGRFARAISELLDQGWHEA